MLKVFSLKQSSTPVEGRLLTPPLSLPLLSPVQQWNVFVPISFVNQYHCTFTIVNSAELSVEDLSF